jgi:uncharacterized membrane protein HdeD (DUF308 family)
MWTRVDVDSQLDCVVRRERLRHPLRMTPRSRSLHKTGRKAVVWITFARGAMAIALGLALALHHDRAPAALANFMGVYWILNGVVTLQWA